MAVISDIKVSIELRPCLVKSGYTENKALFHMWEQRTCGDVSRVLGIVELEDGSVINVAPYQIQFIDNKIQEYVFKPAGSSPEEVQNE